MAYHDAVEYIERMRPDHVDVTAEDFKRVVRLIDSALPQINALPGKLEWISDARLPYEQRLKEAVDLIEALRDAYDKAGRGLDDYVGAQQQAKARVGEGVAAEGELGSLIAPIVASQSFVVRFSDALRQWNDLRSTTGVTDWLIELGEQDDIDAIRERADALWYRATGAYDDAVTIETTQRHTTADALHEAYRMIPDFLANSPNAARIIQTTPGLADAVYRSAYDPNARRPGQPVLDLYQVDENPAVRQYPDGLRGAAGGLAGVEPRTITAAEAAILDELPPLDLMRFNEIRDRAFAEADERFTPEDQNDNHNDAFRHTYWNAMLTREFGEDWARRYTTAHESLPGNPAVREAMDLYNNEQGRSIAVANPDADDDELANLVEQAVRQGRTTVVGTDGQLHFSDEVQEGQTGETTADTLPGRQPIPQATS